MTGKPALDVVRDVEDTLIEAVWSPDDVAEYLDAVARLGQLVDEAKVYFADSDCDGSEPDCPECRVVAALRAVAGDTGNQEPA